MKTSPKRPNTNYSSANGDSLSNDAVQVILKLESMSMINAKNQFKLTPLCISPVQPSHNNQLQQTARQSTNITAYSSSSDSNQSPPSMKTEKGVQTNESFDPMEAGKIDEKKTKEIEGLVRANTELKQTLEVQKGKVRASKETIKRLLVEQSRMQRKQVRKSGEKRHGIEILVF